MSKLNIDQKSVKALFTDKKADFLIPDYQRPYAWEEKECQTLWDDLFDFAFPDDNDMPAGLLQGGLLLFVAGDIACELLGPEFHVGFWHCGDFAAFMAMPEATVDENHRMPFGQNDIGMAGQFR